MPFIVEGYIDMVSYAVNVGLPDSDTLPSSYKQAVGSPAALAVLASHDGQNIDVTPVGPVVAGDCDTPEGVLAILKAYTDVTDVYADDGSDVPDLVGPTDPTHDY